MSEPNAFEDKLEQILNQNPDLPTAPKEKLLYLARISKEHHDRLQEKLNHLQQSLDYLRLSIKYLIFDLEATRRENAELRKRLANSRPNPPENDLF